MYISLNITNNKYYFENRCSAALLTALMSLHLNFRVASSLRVMLFNTDHLQVTSFLLRL